MRESHHTDIPPNAIAIIGMAGRFPEAESIDLFWDNLKNGVESILPTSRADLVASGIDPAELENPQFVNVAAAHSEPEFFDAQFFGYSPQEAELMDPQHRVMLETAWSALEDAGYIQEDYPGLVGVFVGIAQNTYFLKNVAPHPNRLEQATSYFTEIGNEKDFPTAKISYKLNLRGPSLGVQTACSSSGVAVHLARQSLLLGECDIALAGGCRVLVPTRAGYHYIDGGPLSADGKVRTFDAKASGMVRGSGAACIVLKRLKDALEDNDQVYAIVRGTAINNDGSERMGFTAPSAKGQAAVIAEALEVSGLTADQISYVEAHGTGTPVGDPIEFLGLTRAFRQTTSRKQYCAIGSVKTNIGHLDAGAGVAGIIKTVLAMQHESIPPSLNFNQPNPQIDFANSPFFVADRLLAWEKGVEPRRAGVSSLGLGGANAHIVLEEAPLKGSSAEGRNQHLLLVSAKSPSALTASTDQLAEHFENYPRSSLADSAYTLAVGRRHFSERRSICIAEPQAVMTALRSTRRPYDFSENAGVVFMFPGGGAQYLGMGHDIFAEEPVFKEVLQNCSRYLQSFTGIDIVEFLYSPDRSEFPASASIEDPLIALPALFAVEYALAQLWMSWGVLPEAMIGHSMGEYTAACLAEVFSLEDALRVVLKRAELFSSLSEGAMISVPLGEDQASTYLKGRVGIAAVNADALCVLSGPKNEVEELTADLKKEGIPANRLHISVAAHSPAIDPLQAEFIPFLQEMELQIPTKPFISNVTGSWIKHEEAVDPHYWAAHLRQPVRFADGVRVLQDQRDLQFLEIGPGQSLSLILAQQGVEERCFTSMPHPGEEKSDYAHLLEALGGLWESGVNVDWQNFYAGEGRRRVSLPTYPFERKRYWIDPPHRQNAQLRIPADVPDDKKVDDSRAALRPPVKSTTLQNVSHSRSRKEFLLERLHTVLFDLSGITFSQEEDDNTFLELGFDSLFLTQVSTRIQREFDVPLKFVQLMRDFATPNALAEYLDAQLSPEAFDHEVSWGHFADPLLAHTEAKADDSSTTQDLPTNLQSLQDQLKEERLPGVSASLASIVTRQLDIIQQQLTLLAGSAEGDSQDELSVRAQAGKIPVVRAKVGNESRSKEAFGASVRIDQDREIQLSATQKTYLHEFIKKYNQKTKRSKDFAQKYRDRIADPRAVTGFKPFFKETVYPLVVDRSAGAYLWDIDNNPYIDVTNGFGAVLLGHSPDFIVDAIQNRLVSGYEIGPTPSLVGEVSDLLCELTGHERVVFCNTGSEATMGAMRLARTVTGRDKVAMFTNSYHGNYDEVIVRGNQELMSFPAAAGIPQSAVSEMFVLDYDSKKSLEILHAQADDLAAIMVEPVQGHDMNLQPGDFMHQLRQLTRDAGIALIFDEVVTGFRAHLGGAQAYFGVNADLATYGKIMGGGMPIGAIAGRRKFMDALDGGAWRFGDDSSPESGVTYFAGTFVRHPLALAAAKATLQYLKNEGNDLQVALNTRTTELVEGLRAIVKQLHAPVKISQFSSSFEVTITGDAPFGSVLFPLLRYRGIHIFENRKWFLTTAHSEVELEKIARAFQESLSDMMAYGFLPISSEAQKNEMSQLTSKVAFADHPPVPNARLGRDEKGMPAWYIPDPQRPGKHIEIEKVDKG